MTHETPEQVELPRPTVWPLVVGLGLVLIATGVATDLAFSLVGIALFLVGLGGWIGELMPGAGHAPEPILGDVALPEPSPREVEYIDGVPGYRLRLPRAVHPIGAGIKGGIAGGLLMPIPALAYGILSGHGIWYPINLLAGMVLPGIEKLTTEQLEQFNLLYLLLGIVIHAMISLVVGLVYGVILPTLPHWPAGPIFWAGVVMPLLWTGMCHGVMGIVNPLLNVRVDWPWFVVSQLVFGIVAAVVVSRQERIPVPPAGRGPQADSSSPANLGQTPPETTT